MATVTYKRKQALNEQILFWKHFDLIIVYCQSTPLHLAAGYNRVRVVQLLLQHGADVHAKDKG